MKISWWRGTTLLETVILFIWHSCLILKLPCLGSIRWTYFLFSLLQVITRAVGYRGTYEMTSEWFRSKVNSNMGLAYSFYLPQIFMMAMHRNYEKNMPYFVDSTYSKIFRDYIFVSFCMNIMTITIVGFSQTLYRSKKTCAILLIILWVCLHTNLNIHHYSYYFASVIFVILVFVLSRYFPDCFSFGEYSIVCQAIVLIFLSIAQKHYFMIFPAKKQFELQLSSRILIGCVFSCLASIFIYSTLTAIKPKCPTSIGVAFELVAFTGSFLILSLNIQSAISLKSSVSLVSWGFNYLSLGNRPYLVGWWCVMAFFTFLFVIYVMKNPPIGASVILYRKVFHLVVVLCYIPGIVIDEELMCIASAGVLWIFLIYECVRLAGFTSIGAKLSQYLVPFLKQGCLSWFIIPNHFLLLISVSLPVWIINIIYFGDYSKALFAHRMNFLLSCVASVGIGDAAASVFGLLYGKHKISGGRKSYEGVAANFIVQFLLYSITFRIFSGRLSPCYFDFIYFLCSLTTSVIEGLTLQEDNIILPILSMSQMIAFLPSSVD